MSFDLDRLARLWNEPPAADDGEARRAFAEVYADPVVINGEAVGLADLVAMARQNHVTYQDQRREILDVADSGDKVAFAFVLRATQHGRPVAIRVLDILTLTDGLVTEVWAVQQPLAA
nr:nuclear transport factor 2 family protein [uncultured Actinoplanes sp.]